MLQLNVEIHGEEAMQAFGARLGQVCGGHGVIYLRGDLGAGTFNLTAYRQWFDNYIFLEETGLEEDDLPVFQYLQQDADFWGVEAELSYPVVDTDGFRLLADARASYVEAELADGTAVRIWEKGKEQ